MLSNIHGVATKYRYYQHKCGSNENNEVRYKCDHIIENRDFHRILFAGWAFRNTEIAKICITKKAITTSSLCDINAICKKYINQTNFISCKKKYTLTTSYHLLQMIHLGLPLYSVPVISLSVHILTFDCQT